MGQDRCHLFMPVASTLGAMPAYRLGRPPPPEELLPAVGAPELPAQAVPPEDDHCREALDDDVGAPRVQVGPNEPVHQPKVPLERIEPGADVQARQLVAQAEVADLRGSRCAAFAWRGVAEEEQGRSARQRRPSLLTMHRTDIPPWFGVSRARTGSGSSR